MSRRLLKKIHTFVTGLRSANARPAGNLPDIHTLLDISRRISGELKLEKLQQNLIKLVYQASGASRTLLLIQEKGVWYIESELSSGGGIIAQPKAPIGEISGLSKTLIYDTAKVGKSLRARELKLETVCVPLLRRGSILGLVYIEITGAPDLLTEKIKWIELLLTHATVAMENARFYRKMELKVNERTRDLQDAWTISEQLNDFTREINSISALDDIVDRIFDYLHRYFNFENIELLLTDKERKLFRPYRGLYPGMSAEDRDFFRDLYVPLNSKGGFCWEAYRSRRPVYYEILPESLALLDRKVQARMGLVSVLYVPLIIKSSVIGLICITNCKGKLRLALSDRTNILRFCEQVAGAVHTSNLFREAQSAREELEREISLAQQTQESLLPNKPPDISGLRLAFKYSPMMGVGGDFIDLYYDETQRRIGFFICDVSGHGVSAALLACMVKMALREWPDYLDKPAGLLRHIKKSLRGKMGMHSLSATAGYMNLDSGEAILSGAGHPFPLHVGRSGDISNIPMRSRVFYDNPGFPLNSKDYRLQMLSGERLILYTDGITEAERPTVLPGVELDLLNESGLIELVRKHRERAPEDFCERIYDDVTKFTNSINLKDDFTLLVIDYTG